MAQHRTHAHMNGQKKKEIHHWQASRCLTLLLIFDRIDGLENDLWRPPIKRTAKRCGIYKQIKLFLTGPSTGEPVRLSSLLNQGSDVYLDLSL